MINPEKSQTHSIVPEKPTNTPRRNPISKRKDPFSNNFFQHLEIIESDIATGVGFNSGSAKRSGLKLALWTWFSATIDGFVLISISCFFAVLFSFLMKTSPTSVVALFLKNQNLVSVLAILFTITVWSYLIFMRAFMGASVGEWSCDLRLGEPLQRLRLNYVLRVIARTTLIMVTGVVVLPFLSLFLGRDIAGELSGLRIYSLQ